jgi:hypothetical protein
MHGLNSRAFLKQFLTILKGHMTFKEKKIQYCWMLWVSFKTWTPFLCCFETIFNYSERAYDI